MCVLRITSAAVLLAGPQEPKPELGPEQPRDQPSGHAPHPTPHESILLLVDTEVDSVDNTEEEKDAAGRRQGNTDPFVSPMPRDLAELPPPQEGDGSGTPPDLPPPQEADPAAFSQAPLPGGMLAKGVSGVLTGVTTHRAPVS